MEISATSLAATSLNPSSSQAAAAATKKAMDVTSQAQASLVALIDPARGLGQNLNVTA